MSIPKIVHFIAPKNTNNWHPLWIECNQSWTKHFKDFNFIYWDDDELDVFVKINFPNFYSTYSSFPKNILKYDFSRILLLYKFGGIYADMDMYCYKNFYNQLTEKICLLGDTHKDAFYGSNKISRVTVGNSLMCSVEKDNFWLKCVDKMLQIYDYYKNKSVFDSDVNLFVGNNTKERMAAFAVLKMGSEAIAEVINNSLEEYLKGIQFLVSDQYDSDYLEYKPEFFTKHLYTGTWDEQYVSSTNKKEFAVEHYKFLRNVDIGFITDHILK